MPGENGKLDRRRNSNQDEQSLATGPFHMMNMLYCGFKYQIETFVFMDFIRHVLPCTADLNCICMSGSKKKIRSVCGCSCERGINLAIQAHLSFPKIMYRSDVNTLLTENVFNRGPSENAFAFRSESLPYLFFFLP